MGTRREQVSEMIETGRFLNVSTGNLKQETCAWLADQQKVIDAGLIVYPKGVVGYYIAGWAMLIDEKVPADLMQVFDLADLLECDLVCIDRDAHKVDHLPTYDW